MNRDSAPRRSKALLIFPLSFYSFSETILKELSRLGFDVVVANHEYPMNMLGKTLGNLKIFWLLSIITERVFCRNYIANEHYDLVLIFKGRGISNRLLHKIRQAADRTVAYNFDSFGYNPSPLRWYTNVDKYCTFDYADSTKYTIPLVDLYSSIPLDDTPKYIVYDISAILRNHSNRLKYLDAVLNALPHKKAYIYILELNALTFVINFIRSPILYMKYRRNIHFKALPYQDYVSVLKNSNFTLDYAHPTQSGITIRCFEASTTKTKIITNNRFVKHNIFFGDNNTVIVNENADLKDLPKHFDSIRDTVPPMHHRTVTEFLTDLLA